jgi:hypothetical protein
MGKRLYGHNLRRSGPRGFSWPQILRQDVPPNVGLRSNRKPNNYESQKYLDGRKIRILSLRIEEERGAASGNSWPIVVRLFRTIMTLRAQPVDATLA